MQICIKHMPSILMWRLAMTSLLSQAVPISVVHLLSYVRLFVTPWTVAHKAPLSMGLTRQEHWSVMPFPSPGDPLPLSQQGSNTIARNFTFYRWWPHRQAMSQGKKELCFWVPSEFNQSYYLIQFLKEVTKQKITKPEENGNYQKLEQLGEGIRIRIWVCTCK